MEIHDKNDLVSPQVGDQKVEASQSSSFHRHVGSQTTDEYRLNVGMVISITSSEWWCMTEGFFIGLSVWAMGIQYRYFELTLFGLTSEVSRLCEWTESGQRGDDHIFECSHKGAGPNL